MRSYHRIYTGVDSELPPLVDDSFAHGSLRNRAEFTHTAVQLCADAGRERLDPADPRRSSPRGGPCRAP